MPGGGRLTLFNNGIEGPDGDYSAVFELAPPTDDAGRYVLDDTEAFGPRELAWSYRAPDRVSFHSFFVSGAHRLPNGHTFITSGAQGRFFEVTPEGDIVWEYWVNSTGRRNASMMRCCDAEAETEKVRPGGSACDAVAWSAAGSGA